MLNKSLVVCFGFCVQVNLMFLAYKAKLKKETKSYFFFYIEHVY